MLERMNMQQMKLLFNKHSAPEEYDYANLYEAKLIKDKESNIYFGSGYNGPKTLTFYNDKIQVKCGRKLKVLTLNL